MPTTRLYFVFPLILVSIIFNFSSARSVNATTNDLFISEYIEGSSNNKALEFYNGTGSTINLAAGNYTISFYFNGDTTAGSIIPLTGSVNDGDVYVLADIDANGSIKSEADQLDDANFFNGDDVIILTKGNTILDVIGELGVDPGTQWGSGSSGFQNHTQRRIASVCEGDTNASDTFTTNEWSGFGQNNTDNIGSHTANCDGGSTTPAILINEVDVDTPGTDTAEFIELLGPSSTSLNGLVLVLFNGGDDASYQSFDLDGQITDANGYFVVCVDAAMIDNCDLDAGGSSGLLQNGADAVALYSGDAADFPNDTPVTAVNLIDAIVYDTNDADDTGLLSVLTPGNPQVNEAQDSSPTAQSNQRCPNGAGGAFETAVYDQFAPTPGSPNVCSVVVPPASCSDTGLTFTAIPAIQGSGLTSPLVGNVVNVEAIVTGDFQNNGMSDNGDLNGFYIQGSGDNNSATSDGIFVFDSNTDVSVGDLVRVTGTVAEFETSGGASSLTELTNIDSIDVCASGQALPSPTNVTFPLASEDSLERYEGMLVNFPQELVISEYFNFDRFNEIVITNPIDGLERPLQPTAYVDPGAAANAVAAELALNRITLDDGRTSQNSVPARHPNGNDFGPANYFRGGDKLVNTIGVIDDSFGLYRIQPTGGATHIASNPRQASPDNVGGSTQVVSLNVLNYFLTLDNGGDVCGGNQNLECRGADTASEFNRQRDKLLMALLAIDADIYGIVEIENTPGVEPLADLVNGMNAVAGAGTYDYIDTGVIGTDAIRVGIIYNATTVSPAGNFAILDSSVDPTFIDTKNRPALAQTFAEIASGERFTIAVNHFKSKGSACNDVGDPNQDDGQGNCNGTRTDAAIALANWLASDPTGSDDTDVLILGDLNAYDKEDPIEALKDAGYIDLVAQYGGEAAYSYVFDGQFGYLDYALANQSLATQISGVTEWHINADEPDIWDYDESFNDSSFYQNNVYRVSDHDPVIVGIGLNDDISSFTNILHLPLIQNEE